MSSDMVLWEAARAAALAAVTVLGASLLTGMALRTALLAPLARNRAVLELHGYLSWFWLPLLAVHVTALLLDGTARIGLLDLVVPFRVGYARLAVGLGTVGLLLVILVAASGALRRRMPPRLWRAVHRLSYPAFGVFLLHAQLAGSDLGRTWIGVVAWAAAGGLAVLALWRAVGTRAVEGRPRSTS
jgi:methionine sulfoxide reductase heme-binding subunit